MVRSGATGAEAKLKVLIRHLVMSFPHTSILSRQIEDRYHLLVIVPYEGGPEKAIQVERAFLFEKDRSVEDFGVFLSHLNLPTLLHDRERYDLRSASRPHPEQARRCRAVSNRVAKSPWGGSPANGGWATGLPRGTVPHGSLHLSDPHLPAPADPVSHLC